MTNNPFDTNPVWEDITEKANRLVHTFANSTVANGYGLGYRFYLLKGTEEIEITQATIRFADERREAKCLSTRTTAKPSA